MKIYEEKKIADIHEKNYHQLTVSAETERSSI